MSAETFEAALAYFGLFCVILITSQEVRAMLTAVEMAMGTKYRGPVRGRLIAIRYCFTSPLFHQKFATMRGGTPAYSTAGSALLWMLTLYLAVDVGGYDPKTQLAQAMGCAFLTAGGYFVARYGKAFWQRREYVNATNAKGNPLSFSPVKI